MKIPKGLRYYFVITQYGILLIFLTFLGFYLGSLIDNYFEFKLAMKLVLGVLFSWAGLGLLVQNVYKLNKMVEKDKKGEVDE